ncbi:hypothetical protein C2I18_25055 [Paenibacillus sp. PK3_47]|uniref:DUF3169 family protein n=1 Tax=Paenibacillus sp. PK3_47 TaxID=2072642 RepID=UPI00201E1F53|nr:DUF3169 family protein [Paenibacillus sp. PK3_47]UQZ36514.1 hypothetical protein C2I18_25055 [Paenibacillus sp. PK3_47]
MEKAKQASRTRGAIKLIVWMIIGGAIGYIFASGSVTVPADLNFKPSVFYDYDLLFAVLALISVVLTLLTMYGFKKIKGLPEEQEHFHDGSIESPRERTLSSLMQNVTYNMIVSYLWLILSFAHALSPGTRSGDEEIFMLFNMIGGLIFLLLAVFLQHRSFVLYNKQYPDRQMDLRFGSQGKAERELFDKMDEGEQWVVFRSSYAAFKTTSASLVIGMILFALYSLFFGFTPVPMIVLALILIIQQTVYYREAGKYSK